MRKIFRNVFIVFGVLVIGSGCSTVSKEISTSVNTKADAEATDESVQASEEIEETLSTTEQVIADNDNFTVTFKKAVYVNDDYLGESVKFIFEFINKSDATLSLMSNNDASVDGQMVDDLAGFSNPDIAADKTGTVVLEFNSQWLDDSIDQEFPKFEDNMEITLQVFDESWDFEELIPFSVSLK